MWFNIKDPMSNLPDEDVDTTTTDEMRVSPDHVEDQPTDVKE